MADGNGQPPVGGLPPPALTPPPPPPPPPPLEPEEKVAATWATVWSAVYLIIGALFMTAAFTTYDYVTTMGLPNYGSAVSLGERKPFVAEYQIAINNLADGRSGLYETILAKALKRPPDEEALVVAKSNAKMFLRGHAVDLTVHDVGVSKRGKSRQREPAKAPKGTIELSNLGLDFNLIDQAFERYCSRMPCTQQPDGKGALNAWNALVEAQQQPSIDDAVISKTRDTLSILTAASADLAQAYLSAPDGKAAARIPEEFSQYESLGILGHLTSFPLVIQYLIISFCFGAIGAYIRYLGDIFSPTPTTLLRSGGVAVNGAGAAFIVLALSLAGVQVITLGTATTAPATPNPLFVMGISLLAGAVASSILSGVKNLGARLTS